MSVSKLIRHFEALGKIPVAMDDVVAEFRKLILDAGLAVKGVDMPASILRGTHYRYHHEPDPKSAILPGPMALVLYSTQQPLEWQRLVCCKELVHVLDSSPVRTRDREEVLDLGKKLNDKDRSFTQVRDLQWFFDEVAIFQALAILFPFGLREELMGLYSAKRISDEQLAEALQLPAEHVATVMSDRWKLLRESILLPD